MKDRPAVCIYQRFLPPDRSGAGKQAVTLGRAIRAHGWEVLFLTDGPEPGLEVSELAEFRVERVTPPPPDPTNLQMAAYWVRASARLAAMARDFDILQVHTADFSHAGAIPLACLLRKRVLVRSSLAGEFTNLRKWRGGRLQRQIYRCADAFAVLSSRLAREFEDAGLPCERLHHLPNGVDHSIYHPVPEAEKRRLRQELDLPLEGRILVFHGVLMERKSLHWLVDTAGPRLRELDLHLLIVGDPARHEAETGYAAALSEQIASAPFADRIVVRGFQSEIARYLQAADAYVLASTEEGLPNALLEAMAVGLAPLSSRTSGSEDVVNDGVTGFLFEPREDVGFNRCVEQAFGPGSDGRRSAVAAAAAERSRAIYGVDAMVGRYLQVYEELLGIGSQEAAPEAGV